MTFTQAPAIVQIPLLVLVTLAILLPVMLSRGAGVMMSDTPAAFLSKSALNAAMAVFPDKNNQGPVPPGIA